MKIKELKEAIKDLPDDMEYTGKTPEEFEEDYLYIELGGV